MKSKFLIKLLSLLGFSTVATSCELVNEIGGGGAVCMYGSPSASYVFNVDVKDADTNTPIEGMRVSVVREISLYNKETGKHDIEALDTLAYELTNDKGKATLFLDRDLPTSSHLIIADDIDGAENGGLYSTVSTEVLTQADDYKNPGSSGWFDGTATHNVTFATSKQSEQ